MRKIWMVAASLGLGYLLGCSNMAFYLGRIKGVDMRRQGSGNLGTSNTLVHFGFRHAALVLLHDMGKAALAVFLAGRLFPNQDAAGHVAGMAAVMGHIFPFYLHFRGGRGFASILGMALALEPRSGLLFLLSYPLLLLVTDYVALSETIIVLAIWIYAMLRGCGGMRLVCLELVVLAFVWVHRQSYRRLLDGTEPGFLRKRGAGVSWLEIYAKTRRAVRSRKKGHVRSGKKESMP